MKTWQQRIKKIMRAKRITQEALSEQLGVSQSALSHWLSGRRGADVDIVMRIASAIGESMSIIFSEEDIWSARENESLYTLPQHHPHVSWDTIGVSSESPSRRWICPVACSPATYVLSVQGISMEPVFQAGQIVYVDPEHAPQHGDYVIARISEHEQAILRQYIVEGGQKLLRAINPDWPDGLQAMTRNSRILGTVIFTGRTLINATAN